MRENRKKNWEEIAASSFAAMGAGQEDKVQRKSSP